MKQTSIFLRVCACILTAGMLLATFTACGGKQPTQTPTTEPAVTDAQTVPAAETVPEDAETVPAETETASEADATEAQTPADATQAEAKPTEAETTEAEKKMPQTKEEIVALYNESANAVKYGSKSVTSNYTLNTQTSDAQLSSKMLQNIANKLISANMGYDQKKANVTYTGQDSIRQNFPARGKDWVSKLTAADVTKATCTEKDGVYTVTLYLVPDTTPNIKQGEGHAGKAFSIITKEQIVEGAGSLGMSVIQEDSIKLTFKNCKITAKIDAETGKLQSVNYFIDWTLALTAIGIDVAVSFGAEDDYTIHW